MQTQLGLAPPKTNLKSNLHLLIKAKKMSDARNFPEKNKILGNLFMTNPDEFVIDSELNDKFVGITHVPTAFRIHAPRNIIPYTIKKQDAIEKIASDLIWSYVPEQVATYIYAAKPAYEKIAKTLFRGMQAWLSPVSGEVIVSSRGPFPSGDVSNLLKQAGIGNTIGRPDLNEAWILVKSAGWGDTPISSIAGPIAQAFMLKPSKFSDSVGGATPLASMLAGGALTAGLGYGAGWLAEKVAPGIFQKGKTRKRLAIIGGLLGTLPGAISGGMGMASWDNPQNPDRNSSSFNAFTSPHPLYGAGSSLTKASWALAQIQPEISEEMEKSSSMFDHYQGFTALEPIPVDAFNRLVMNDPFSNQAMQSATMGLVGAANNVGGSSGFITPMDIARVGMGMGAGYVQASIGGRVLGALVGLTPQAQGYLQQAGVVAGALKAIIPGMFGY